MQQIFIRQEDIIDNRIRVIGEDANHLGKVLRMKAGEKLRVSTDTEKNYLCEVSGFKADAVELTILEEADNTEPSVLITSRSQSHQQRWMSAASSAVEKAAVSARVRAGSRSWAAAWYIRRFFA